MLDITIKMKLRDFYDHRLRLSGYRVFPQPVKPRRYVVPSSPRKKKST